MNRIILHDYGGYHFTFQLAQALSENIHQVNYIYSKTTQQLKRFQGVTSENLEVRGITLSRAFDKYNYLQRWQSEREYGNRIASEIIRFEPDIVLSANTPLDAQRLIYNASRQVGAKFVFWLQDAIGLATRQALSKKIPLLGSAVGHYYQRLEQRLVRHSDQVILIAEDFLPLMESWGVPAEKTHVIPNWAPLDQIPPQPKDNPWAVTYGLSKKFCFLYSGILGLKHDPDVLLSLAEHFRDKDDVRVVVISAGERFAALQTEKAARQLDNLVLLDFQPAQAYPLVLASGDILVSILSLDASQYSVPSKVLSYLCAQRPVLLSIPLDNQAAKLVKGAHAGLAAAPGDLHSFLSHAQSLYSDPALCQRMGRAARRYAEVKFNIDIIKHTFLDMINF